VLLKFWEVRNGEMSTAGEEKSRVKDVGTVKYFNRSDIKN
jgi:hypothetical protein